MQCFMSVPLNAEVSGCMSDLLLAILFSTLCELRNLDPDLVTDASSATPLSCLRFACGVSLRSFFVSLVRLNIPAAETVFFAATGLHRFAGNVLLSRVRETKLGRSTCIVARHVRSIVRS